MCNKFGQIISLSMYENSITGVIPNSISDLTHLLTFNIWNDAREYEGDDNIRKNTITNWNSNIHNLLFLEEINFINLEMSGSLDSTFTNMVKIKVINLTKNLLSGTLPDTFGSLPDLEFLQLSHNTFSGTIPVSLNALTKLKFVELNNNAFTGSAPIFLSQELIGLEISDNSLSGSFPISYFSATSYLKLEFINVLFNQIIVPDHCLKYVY
mmetsp:Transcript_15083/g.13238  ORF Transcript_15083/g.13238 Transcript_15083/m.13238 type:complete len:211 (-) Transcript_15083:103-735(-)